MKKTNEKVVGSKAAANMVASNVANHENAIRVMVFECSEFGCIRILTDEKGEPQFCGNDVCKALGYDQARKAILRHVKPTDGTKRTASVTIRRNGSVYEQKRSLHFVNESGFYALVLGSKLPTAQRFKHWVTSVVLPQIRKTGGFIPLHEGESDEEVVRKTEEILRKTLREKDSFIAQQDKLISEQKVLLEQKNRRIAEQDVEIDRLLPKALYTDSVLDSISCYTTTQIAKELGMTAQELNRWLCAERIQYYQSGQYMLYADYAHRGLAKSRTHYDLFVGRDTVLTRMYLVWTEKGREFIHLRAKGVRELKELRS